ncbi:MAG: 6-bladed beta-propeller, partial [Planctomycetota bacterium]
MKLRIFAFLSAAILLCSLAITTANAQDASVVSTTGVKMGSGIMTFETVPGWGLRPDGKSPLGPTHGGVVVDKDGNVYTSAKAGVFVFSPDGKVVQTYTSEPYTQMHDIEIRQEGDREFIYGARDAAGEGIKFDARSGEVILRLPFPKESGLDLKRFKPTAITVAVDGRIFLSDGYASNTIFVFDANGKYLSHFGRKGNGMHQFNTAHGMTLDTRYQPARLLICDRNHQPRGRLLHYSLEGEFISEVITGLGMPTSVAIQGEYVSIPDLMGRVVILNGENVV